jgi:penicillin-binding protein 2
MVLATALANSCDTYFYDVALRFYERPDSPLQRWSRKMGFGQSTGVDLGPEEKGLVPTPAWRRRTFKTEIDKIWTSGDSVQLSIGQGDLLVTPLQMARAYAMIANGGKLVEPHLIKAVEEPRSPGEQPVVLRPYTPKPARDLGIDPYVVVRVRAVPVPRDRSLRRDRERRPRRHGGGAHGAQDLRGLLRRRPGQLRGDRPGERLGMAG